MRITQRVSRASVQLNQMYHEKFNGISLFSMSRSERLTNPPDLRPTLDKTTWSKTPKVVVIKFFQKHCHHCRWLKAGWKHLAQHGQPAVHAFFGRSGLHLYYQDCCSDSCGSAKQHGTNRKHRWQRAKALLISEM